MKLFLIGVRLIDFPSNTDWKVSGSYGSHRIAVIGDIARVTLEMGTYPTEIRNNYNHPKSPAEGAAHFELPKTRGNIIAISNPLEKT